MKVGANSSLIELEAEGLTQSTSLHKAQLIIFKEKNGDRHLPLLVNKADYDRLFQVIVHHDYSGISPLENVMRTFGIELKAIILSRDGENNGLHALLAMVKPSDDENHIIPESLPVGVALGLSCNVPFYITESDFNAFYNKRSRDGQVAIPLSNMPEDLLEEALQQAADSDNFELASLLRDELRKRDNRADTATEQ